MKISQWLDTLNPRGIMNQEITARDFFEQTGHEADWPVHRVAECRDLSINSKESEQHDSLPVAYAWEIARNLCMVYAGYDPFLQPPRKRGECFRLCQRAIDALAASGF